MKVKLLRDCKPFGRTGEIAEVSPDHFEWLESLGYAVPVTEARERAEEPEKAEKPAEKKTAAKKPAAKKK
jgi:ribosomal protein L9